MRVSIGVKMIEFKVNFKSFFFLQRLCGSFRCLSLATIFHNKVDKKGLTMF